MKLRNKKTGEIKGGYSVAIYENALGDGLAEYRTIYELNEEWEDYNPAEPLIKDEKIRKAVRAWAEASDVGVTKVTPHEVFDVESSAHIRFYGRVVEDKGYDGKKSYTIAELCGEEEECES